MKKKKGSIIGEVEQEEEGGGREVKRPKEVVGAHVLG